MLREKQSMAAQNSQLWRLVDKQRTMIVGLNKDLERAMKEKERYRNKLKEKMGTPPSAPTVTQSPSRTTTESPAPSLDEVQSRVEPSSMMRHESVTSNASSAIAPSQHPNDAMLSMDMSSWPADLQPIANGSAPVDHYGHSPASTGIANPSNERSGMDPLVVRIAEPQSPISSQVISPISPTSQDKGVPSTPRRPGLYTSVSPPTNLGRSPIRKAPPAPLELIASQLHKHALEQNDAEDQEGEEIPPRQDSKDDTSQGINDGDDSRQPTPEDKIASTVSITAPGFFNDAPLSAPPTRSPPVPHFGPPMTPNPSSTEMFHGSVRDAADSPEKIQFMRVPQTMPGLPLSPRPADRPPNSPMPRGSRVFSLAEAARIGLPESPKPYIQAIPPFKTGGPRASMPPPATKPSTALSSTLPALGNERRGSEGSTPATPASAPIDSGNLLIQPSAISSIDSWVVSSRLKPSRISMLPGTPRTGLNDSVFTLGVFSRVDGKEILRVEKDVGSLPALDEKLRKYVSYHAKVPDRSLFTGFAPARVDARRAAIDDFFAGVLGATMDERAALMLCEFFSTDVVEHWVGRNVNDGDEKDSPSTTDSPTALRVVKEGYLTKRGKNFGGWKERYFILDGPVLKYFDGPGGVHLGQIKLQNAQIGRQSASPKIKDDGGVDEDNQYRHAFLILEPKRKDSSTLVRHVLCAENDKERDEWVQCLLDYVHGDREEDVQKDVRRTKSDGNKETNPGGDSLRGMSYDQVSQGPPPARGPSPESLNRQQVSPSPSSFASQVSGQHSAHSPAPDRGSAKQISAPTNGAVISDLSAWGASKTAHSSHEDKKTEKAIKKRSIWGFRQRTSSDLDDNVKAGAQSGHQQAAEKFPLSRAVFGASLEEAVYLTRPPGLDVALPAVVHRCIEYLEAKNASEEEGIFRLSGSNVVIKGLREKFNTGITPTWFCIYPSSY
jgi:RalA-binding protein 1